MNTAHSVTVRTAKKKFRVWLKKKYGTTEELNKRWNTSFWGRTVYDFDTIMLPTERNDDDRFFPAKQLDYQRFVTDTTEECFLNEANVLQNYSLIFRCSAIFPDLLKN